MPGYLVIRNGQAVQVEEVTEELIEEVDAGDVTLIRVGAETDQFEEFESDGDGGGEWSVVEEG